MHPSRTLSLACLCALVACGGPFAVFPGGALDGPVRAAPEGFAFARDAGTVQLETRPGDPYSVNVACAVVGDALYVSSGDSPSHWVEHMQADPRVRVRIDGVIYEARAERVTDPDEMRAFAEEWTKHAWARDPTGLDEVWVYRLQPR
jgi:hypothetical protein